MIFAHAESCTQTPDTDSRHLSASHKKKPFRKVLTFALAAVMAASVAGSIAQPAQAASRSKTARARTAWNFLRSQGFSKKATAGILGNMDQESGISATSRSGSCYGLIQWTGSRKSALRRYARKQGTGTGNLKTQLKFMVYKDCSGLKRRMARNDSSVAQATRYFEVTYERAGIPAMSRRISKANYWYKKFA
ncbi:hypothetical protein CXIVA_15650 [Clostridium sp. SY8519]|uniref:phage tail tip lysozyme n=1 Tax=Clostridium sp. (strain SY8519) TaxID=1042156 RepID=UPI0002171AD4|nr:phage tail tip lysozyme [Clostridium sp. SY8519]BAK47531.1 hypothetical protein CXIVA_15650 [Clostridium sp. SY8519]